MILGNHADGKKIFFKRVALDDMIGGAFGINISLSNY
jgi:hypothetical protein